MRGHLLPGIALALSAAVVAGLVGASACGDSTPNANPTRTPSAEATSSAVIPTSTATQTTEDEIAAAYLAYWDVYAQSVLNLDESHLADVMTGAMLAQTKEEIANLRQRGTAAKIQVEHNFFVAEVDRTAGTATVVDNYTDRSYQVDAATKQAIATSTPTGTRISDTYALVWTGETWKVKEGVRTSN